MPVITHHIQVEKPLLGICLGLQLLFTESTEGGRHKGLDYFKGVVKRLPRSVKVPHMGWNSVIIKQDANPLVESLTSGVHMYFVHSYYGQLLDQRHIVCETKYGVRFPSVISKGNVYATQFHPEKSGRAGLRLIENFLNIVRR